MPQPESKRSFRIGWRGLDRLLRCHYPQQFQTVTEAEKFLDSKHSVVALRILICTPMGTPVEFWKPGKPYTAWM